MTTPMNDPLIQVEKRMNHLESLFSDILEKLQEMHESQERIEEKLDEMGYAVGTGFGIEFDS